MHKQSLRHVPSPFCFDDLPADVQLLVLSNTDLQSLQNLTIALPSAMELFLSYPSTILQGVLASLEPQIRNLLTTTSSLTYTIKYPGIYPPPDLNHLEDFLAKHLDTDSPVPIENLEHDPLGALHSLCSIDKDITNLVTSYAQSIYAKLQQHLNSEQDVPSTLPPLSLFPAEYHRISLALHHTLLFHRLFHSTLPPPRTHPAIPSIHTPFFQRLHAHEIDGLVCVYNYVYSDKRYVRFIHPYLNCTCEHGHAWETGDLWNHQGKCELYGGRKGVEWRRAFESSEALWDALIRRDFLHGRGKAAQVNVDRENASVVWKNGGGGPSEGWRRWREICDGVSVRPHYYRMFFGELGYCFWDEDRVDGWVGIWTGGWYRVEVEKAERREMAEQYGMLLPGGHLWMQLKERERRGQGSF
jgi:hypothetical protein